MCECVCVGGNRHFILGGSGGISPKEIFEFRPSEITSGAFSSIVLLCSVVLCLY